MTATRNAIVYESSKLSKMSRFGYEWRGPYTKPKDVIPKTRNLCGALEHWGYEILFYAIPTDTSPDKYNTKMLLFYFFVDRRLEERHEISIRKQLGIPLTHF